MKIFTSCCLLWYYRSRFVIEQWRRIQSSLFGRICVTGKKDAQSVIILFHEPDREMEDKKAIPVQIFSPNYQNNIGYASGNLSNVFRLKHFLYMNKKLKIRKKIRI